jgi:single-strand DNA-binding protein
MGTINQVFVLGHLGSDPEFHTTASGNSRCELSVATNHSRGEGKENSEVTWHRVKLWRQSAEVARDHLKKGDAVAIAGRIVHEEWTNKEGEPQRRTVIVGDRLTLIGNRPSNKHGGPA